MFTVRLQRWVRRTAQRLAVVLAWLHLSPNAVTLIGTAITFAAAALVAVGQLRPAGLVLLLGASLDIFDGALARLTDKSYTYGAFLDSTADRYAEGAIYLGMLVFFVSQHAQLPAVAVLVALAGSFLVSYVRARAQSLGFTCDGGLFARPERVVLAAIGLLVSVTGLEIVIYILALATNFTALQRIYDVWRQAREQRLAARDDMAHVAEEYRRSQASDRIAPPPPKGG